MRSRLLQGHGTGSCQHNSRSFGQKIVKKPPPLITLDKIAVRLRDRLILADTCWKIKAGQHWAVLGPNGAGKSSLVRALAGDLPIVRGRVIRSSALADTENIKYVSFELHRHLIHKEEHLDEARIFSGHLNSFTTVRDIIETKVNDDQNIASIAKKMGISHLMDRGIRFLSTGEMRKVLIARAMAGAPRLLILDEPFDGLDISGRKHLAGTIRTLMNGSTQIILVTHRMQEILPGISHILRVADCRVIDQNQRTTILNNLETQLPADPLPRFSHFPSRIGKKSKIPLPPAPDPIIQMKNVSVQYGDNRIIHRLNWVVRPNENWAIMGPNGAGKTTLLNLISGDHLQAYANEIFLFGRQKGSGESIWEIKQHIGLVSSEFQVRYRKSLQALDVVLSGFFDSVGLYRPADSGQKKTAQTWMQRLNIADLAHHLFDRLSYGQQRMVLLARAMVKSPALLILDEPCQGLDCANRALIFKLIDFIGMHTTTQILYVTHHPHEIPACTTHILQFVSRFKENFGTRITALKRPSPPAIF
jgi:molybdate transport system ATP-binding protein